MKKLFKSNLIISKIFKTKHNTQIRILNSNQLISLPAFLESLTNLTSLQINNNPSLSELPLFIGKLTNLENLYGMRVVLMILDYFFQVLISLLFLKWYTIVWLAVAIWQLSLKSWVSAQNCNFCVRVYFLFIFQSFQFFFQNKQTPTKSMPKLSNKRTFTLTHSNLGNNNLKIFPPFFRNFTELLSVYYITHTHTHTHQDHYHTPR